MQVTTNNDSEHFILKSFRLAIDEKKGAAFFSPKASSVLLQGRNASNNKQWQINFYIKVVQEIARQK